ncbi:hypothetical protein EI90DRAFT_3010829 [Cantharellus anzutake]|nr:hypothetical protein EI90DRAFT_3010829 [Cantharellus anzutake]
MVGDYMGILSAVVFFLFLFPCLLANLLCRLHRTPASGVSVLSHCIQVITTEVLAFWDMMQFETDAQRNGGNKGVHSYTSLARLTIKLGFELTSTGEGLVVDRSRDQGFHFTECSSNKRLFIPH